MTITIEIPDSAAERLTRVLRTMQKPPRVMEDGSVVIEPVYRDLSEWIAEILATNFQNYLAGNPDEQERQMLAQMEQIRKQMVERIKPRVSIAEMR